MLWVWVTYICISLCFIIEIEHEVCRSDAYAQLYSAPEIARGWQNRGKSAIIMSG